MIGGVASCREVTGISVGIHFSSETYRSDDLVQASEKGALNLNGDPKPHYVVKKCRTLVSIYLNRLPAWQPTSRSRCLSWFLGLCEW